MVSRPIASTMPRLSTSSTISRTVQRARPSGGGPHTMATMAADCRASSSGGGDGRFASLSATSTPELRYRSPTRRTDGTAEPIAAAVAASVLPSSSICSVRIRFQVRSESRSRALWRRSSRSSVLSLSPGNGGRRGASCLMGPVDQVFRARANSRLIRIDTTRSEH